MIALARIRALGVAVELRGDQLALRPAIPSAIEIAKAHKPAIIDALRSEVFDGPSYGTSAYLIRIEDMYDIACALERFHETKELAAKVKFILRARDEAFMTSYDRGLAAIGETQAELMRLADEIAVASGYMLTGDALAAAVRQEVRAADVDMGALA